MTTTTVVKIGDDFFQEVHPFMDDGWIKFHRSLITQVIPGITSLATLKVLMLFLEQTTDCRGRDVAAELSVRLIARKMELSPTSAEKAVRELLARKIVRLAQAGNRVTAAVYELNRDFILLEPVRYVAGPTADAPIGVPIIDTPTREGVSIFGTPPAEGVPEVDTPTPEGVPIFDTPPAENAPQVYQNLVQVKEEELREELREEKRGGEAPHGKTARPNVISGPIDRTPGGMGYTLPADAPLPPRDAPAAAARRTTRAPVGDVHPTVKLLQELTGYWPGEDNIAYIIRAFGDAPDRTALARAVELWRASGFKSTNLVGIHEWYDALRQDANWQPSERFNGRKNGDGRKNGPADWFVAPVEIEPGLY